VSRRAQQGVVLFIALIVLVAMSLAGIALMRSVDTNVLIAGNLAFRQGATMAGDWGIGRTGSRRSTSPATPPTPPTTSTGRARAAWARTPAATR
jgi:Tfp pilus assembly protein PilX